MGDLLVLLAHVTDDLGAAERPELRIVSRANDEVPGRFTFPAASRSQRLYVSAPPPCISAALRFAADHPAARAAAA
jgi:hypothetical protein